MLSTAGAGIAGTIPVVDALRPGQKAGPWVVERELGRGGMGAVYAVVHDEIGKRAALKVVHGRLLGAGFNPDRMLVEARVVNQVGHPNIVDIFETGQLADGRPYIVMERLDGEPLSNRADAGKIRPDLVVEILLQICDALVAAHAVGVVHRDLKLDNVFLADNPEDPGATKVKLLDWGIAKVIHHDLHHTVEGQLVGTPQYIAPEQARGAYVSPKADVYSLGVMAYELFLEQLPFTAETAAEVMVMHLRAVPPPPRELWPDIPQQLEALLLEMLEKDPDDRPTMAEVADRLEGVRTALVRPRAASTGHAVGVPVEPVRRISVGCHAATEHAAEWVRRGPRWQYAIGALALVATAALFVVARGSDSATAAAAPPSAAELPSSEPPAHSPLVPEPTAVENASMSTRSAPAVVAITGASPASPRAVTAASPATALNAQPRPLRADPPSPGAPGVRPRLGTSPTRPGPATPRRIKKLDPNGTVDPYR